MNFDTLLWNLAEASERIQRSHDFLHDDGKDTDVEINLTEARSFIAGAMLKIDKLINEWEKQE